MTIIVISPINETTIVNPHENNSLDDNNKLRVNLLFPQFRTHMTIISISMLKHKIIQ